MNESSSWGLSGQTDPFDERRRLEKGYRALLEGTGQSLWSWTADGEAIDCHRGQIWWMKLTGQSIEDQQASADAWLRMVHPDDRAGAFDSWATARSTNMPYESQFRVRARTGDWRRVHARGIPIHGAEGAVRRWIGTLADVTDQFVAREERERLLAQAEAERKRLEAVFRHAPSFIAVLRGPEHVFERVNDHYVELIGGRNVVGSPIRKALPEIEGQGYFELLDQVYRTGKPYLAADASVTLSNPAGSTDRILQFVYQPMFDSHGSVNGVIVQGIDLTNRRQVEVDLARITVENERQRRMYETVLSNTADFLYLFDTSGHFTYVNKALLDLWGKDLSQAVGRTFFELDYPPELSAKLQEQILQVVRTGLPLRDETPYTSPSGTGFYEYIFVPVFGVDGVIEAVAGSTRDVTDRKQTETALRESEQRYRALVTATSDVVYRMSADWSEMQPLDGRGFLVSTTEPVRNWMDQNVPSFEQPRTWATINNAIAERSTFQLEHQVKRVDGSLGWTFSRAIPVLDAAGQIVEWFGTASDITRRKVAESELSDIRSRMEAALAAGAIGTWSWDVQADRFYGDGSLAKMFAVSPEDVAGSNLSRILPTIHPDDRDRVNDLIRRAIENGDRYEASYRVAQPGGFWKWVTARGQIERDAEGRPIRFPGVVIDVTDWKRAQEDLARLTDESARRKRVYETILSNTPDFAYVFDLDHKVAYANETLLRMWGRSWEEAIGKTFLEIGYEPWHAEMHNREIDTVRQTREPLRGEVPFNGTFGRRIYDYIFVPVIGTNGEVEAVAGTTRDVTDRKEAEEALRLADRKKDDFLALLAHELRNPLAPIRNGLEVMRLAEGDPEMLSGAREMMERQLSHMVRLIDDLLDISRITRNKMELRRAEVLLSDVVRSAVEAAAPVIEEAGHELAVLLPAAPIALDADLTRLAQVFSNLLTNSAKYTSRGGTIWLSAEQADDEAIVSVRDTGIGIPAEALPTIFDMFSQVDRSVERSKGGLGIGLALVKGLVEMHGGSVTAESMEGNGSTFTVRLPLLTRSPMAGPASVGSDVPAGARRRILVVDDNRDGATSMAMMLRLLGNEVKTAHDGLEAVAASGAFRPDVILMDIGLPRLNGLDATRQIRAQPWGQDVAIVALTGWGQENDREQSRQAGCNGHLVKPVELAGLRSLLESLTKPATHKGN